MTIFEGLTAAQQDWLTNKASLTQRLRTFTQGKISHHLLYNDWEKNDANAAWVRCMEWRYKNHVWVACVVTIPKTSLNTETDMLLHIGENSIGDVLFQDPALTRSDFVFSKIGDGWKRESIFHYKKQPIWLIENFKLEFFDAIS